MHILIIPSWYPETPDDINGSFFREQALALVKAGHKVGVIYPHIRTLRKLSSVFKSYGFAIENDAGIETFRYFTLNFIPKIDFWGVNGWVKFGLALFEKYIQKFGIPDVIHVHSLDKAGYLAFEIFKKHKISYIVTEHSTAFSRRVVSSAKINDLSCIVKSAKKTIAVSKELALILEEEFLGSNWTYIPNIVSKNFTESSYIAKDNDCFTFINVCLLDKKKRVDLLIIAFSKFCKLHKNVKLQIGGDGPCKSELIQLTEKLGVRDKVSFLGLLRREDVVLKMASADAFVLSSEYETFGVVLIEALALGKPVVATRCGGPESIVTEDVGVLVEKNSAEALFEGMNYLYENISKFSQTTIKKYCIDNFSEEAVTKKLTIVYQSINN